MCPRSRCLWVLSLPGRCISLLSRLSWVDFLHTMLRPGPWKPYLGPQQPQQQGYQNRGGPAPPRPNVFSVICMAFSMPPLGQTDLWPDRVSFGSCCWAWSVSIIFSDDPLPATAPLLPSQSQGNILTTAVNSPPQHQRVKMTARYRVCRQFRVLAMVRWRQLGLCSHACTGKSLAIGRRTELFTVRPELHIRRLRGGVKARWVPSKKIQRARANSIAAPCSLSNVHPAIHYSICRIQYTLTDCNDSTTDFLSASSSITLSSSGQDRTGGTLPSSSLYLSKSSSKNFPAPLMCKIPATAA